VSGLGPTIECVAARHLRVGDTLELAMSEYLVRAIKVQDGLRLVTIARVTPGLIVEDFGRLVLHSTEMIRRLVR